MLRLSTRRFGSTSLETSPLGLAGSFGIDADAVERAYHEHGINYFFVTPRMTGLVEGIRRLIKSGHRERIILACGSNIPIGGRIEPAFNKDCKALGVDRIDVWHLFWVQYHFYVTGQTWPAMRKLKDEGKVSALAISCHDRPLATSLVDELGLDALMIRYNAAHRGAEKEIFAPLANKRPAIIAYTATRWGRLLKPVKGFERAMEPSECYRFILESPSVDVALCGARDYAEIKQDVEGVLAGPLAPARREEILRFGDAVRATAAGRVF